MRWRRGWRGASSTSQRSRCEQIHRITFDARYSTRTVLYHIQCKLSSAVALQVPSSTDACTCLVPRCHLYTAVNAARPGAHRGSRIIRLRDATSSDTRTRIWHSIPSAELGYRYPFILASPTCCSSHQRARRISEGSAWEEAYCRGGA